VGKLQLVSLHAHTQENKTRIKSISMGLAKKKD